ncbi:MAG TPA: hypothetical protein VNK24_01885 [Elusimicrobiota bacterium]|nr:hypothetical protein [Elusimicrobiota bacterium]
MKTSATKFLAAGAALALALPSLARAGGDFEARDSGSFQMQNPGVPDEAALPAVDGGLAFDLQDMGQRPPGANLSADQLDALLPAATLPAPKTAAPSAAPTEAMTPENSSGIAAWLDRRGLRGPLPAAETKEKTQAPQAERVETMTPENSSGIAAWLDRHHLRGGAAENILSQAPRSVNFDGSGAASREASSAGPHEEAMARPGAREQNIGRLIDGAEGLRGAYGIKIARLRGAVAQLPHYGLEDDAVTFQRIRGEVDGIDGEIQACLSALLTPLRVSEEGEAAAAVRGLSLERLEWQMGLLENRLRANLSEADALAREIHENYYRTASVQVAEVKTEAVVKRPWYFLGLIPVKVQVKKTVTVSARRNKKPFVTWTGENSDITLDLLKRYADQKLPAPVLK